ncbi:MAG: preprotein translocase subunit SecG [Magnetococcales bacterium]|nr:preprotein translocase subunit SecG [Magnetococcales bacterium]
MTLIITVVHILVSLALIFVVLLQKGSGADMGAAFGGSSQSVFGARGSGSFLGKLTATLATIFMVTSLSLAFFTTQKGAGTSVMGVSSTEPTATEKKQPVPAPENDTPPLPPKGQSAPREKDAASEPVKEGAKPVPTMDSPEALPPVVPKDGAPKDSVPVSPASPPVPLNAPSSSSKDETISTPMAVPTQAATTKEPKATASPAPEDAAPVEKKTSVEGEGPSTSDKESKSIPVTPDKMSPEKATPSTATQDKTAP